MGILLTGLMLGCDAMETGCNEPLGVKVAYWLAIPGAILFAALLLRVAQKCIYSLRFDAPWPRAWEFAAPVAVVTVWLGEP